VLVSFQEAVSSVLTNYANFSGRAMRSEYWYWALFQVLASIAANIVDGIATQGILAILVGLGLFVPSLAVAVRRLHDVGKSGWNLLWGLIPILGAIYLIYLAIQPSQPGTNSYGPARGGALAAA
jgi:uncharacterized membrane protein YhaH (DUF805 family)